MSIFWTFFFNIIRSIHLCDKKDLTFVDCWDKIILNFVLKNVIDLAKGSLNNIFQDSFNIILSQQLTHNRSDISFQFDSPEFGKMPQQLAAFVHKHREQQWERSTLSKWYLTLFHTVLIFNPLLHRYSI